ncbi:MAG: 3-deoxy-manno-octulosonate cytidylyltransferase [Gammaproteobacteria bacterium]|nr:3-deoxy-manno-octulosonate cytidylyltransferase [Gammaproteobacteria bacterium]
MVIIPSRYGSTRLPGKPLIDIAGQPLLQHVFDAATRSQAGSVHIATDDERVKDLAESFGASAVMTSAAHRSGTDRLAEAADILNLDENTIVVNLQGDEVGMSEKVIDQVARLLSEHADCNMATICEPVTDPGQINDPNVVKVICDGQGRALYFSRSVIPWPGPAAGNLNPGGEAGWFRHIGLYAYRAGFLRRFTGLPVCDLEKQESLEQLRALYHGESILVETACESTGIGVDTQQDLERARQVLG